MRLFGIPNCDTVKKARTWLNDHGIDYEFHDYRKQPIAEATLKEWLRQVGWQRLLKKDRTDLGQVAGCAEGLDQGR